MKREIEFRGWDHDTERWYYGSYVRLERSTPYPMSPFPEHDKAKFEAEQVDHYIFFTQSGDWGLPTTKLRATVDPESVGEYIGQKDSDGKKIYEGDLIQVYFVHNNTTQKDGRPTEVRFDDEGTGFLPFISGCGGCDSYAMRGLSQVIHNHRDEEYGYYLIRVVGNVFDNKEKSPKKGS